jgi:hypothetical protein
VCLNVSDKPNPLQQWDEKLDTPDQQIIKKDCQTYAGKLNDDLMIFLYFVNHITSFLT